MTSHPMPYPGHEAYSSLYARYLKGSRSQELLELAGHISGKKVADLCGGGGRLSHLAWASGAQVTLVDESAPMTELSNAGCQVRVVNRSIKSWMGAFFQPDEFDVVFCQQGINYWLDAWTAETLAEMIRPAGIFIFNTFNRKPSTTPAVKQYELGGVNFVEVSWLVGENCVEHVQIREGEAPHSTRFQWISSDKFRELLSPYFECTENIDGVSSVWVCTRR